MNKTILTAGGVGLASLAVGAAGGYLIAKKRFHNTLDEMIGREIKASADIVTALKKQHAVQLIEARSGKPEEIPTPKEPDPENIYQDGEVVEVEEDLTVSVPRARQTTKGAKAAKTALTDYRGISTKGAADNDIPGGSQLVQSNIFEKDEKKKRRLDPPRRPDGTFISKADAKAQREEEPYRITEEEFLANDMDHQQESLRYYKPNHLLVQESNFEDVVDVNRVGEVLLTLFPETDDYTSSYIWVRNEGLGMDYEIQRMDESFTDALGLGGGGKEPDNPAAYV